ncbi:MAG: adenylate cyclase [Oscillospiraceae bacterium]|nr:adenylate cyclase [Oscillospiraceae bacterium]
MEIERKWFMREPPALPEKSHTMVWQSYLSLLPEVRIRRYRDLLRSGPYRFDLTIKSEGVIAREEIIKDLTEEEYRILLEMNDGRAPIVKDHRTYAFGKYILEYSVVDPERPEGFTYAEVEFPTLEEAEAFQAPDWFGEETTHQPGRRMRSYWRMTRLGEKP